MSDAFADWELVSRRVREPARGPFGVMRRFFSHGAVDNTHFTTFTVRHRATGLVRKLTARTELEARVKIANGLFDAA